jgi:hypothetical protein
MDISMCHNGAKVTDALDKANVIRAALGRFARPEPLWLLASGFWLLASGSWLLASGFWLLGILKHRMTDRQLQSPTEILYVVRELWNEVTLKQLQTVFLALRDRTGSSKTAESIL